MICKNCKSLFIGDNTDEYCEICVDFEGKKNFSDYELEEYEEIK